MPYLTFSVLAFYRDLEEEKGPRAYVNATTGTASQVQTNATVVGANTVNNTANQIVNNQPVNNEQTVSNMNNTAEQEKVKTEIPIGAIDINLYRDDLSSLSEFPEIKETDIPFDITGKTILLVDDVLYTGRTIRAALNALFEYGRPKKVALLVLVDRFGRELPVSANYVGLALNVPEDQYVSVRVKELEGEDLVLLKDRN